MAPVDNSRSPKGDGFELISSLKSNDTIPVFKYKSRKTGITVFIAEVDGPVVGGNFCFATETFDDDGLPHTLEHLIFLGSEDYPYKGVLDLLGNRCLASGTNAWTDKDHTNYTMTTVGSEGFLSLLPIYLDHVLFPNLTDAGFLTEVYHISGEGEDRGVVYCEMQSSENSGTTLCCTELTRLIYPGKCGYKSVTGGIMKNLRESTTNEKVKAYHQEYYRPENLTIIITGQIDHSAVFKSLERIEAKIITKNNLQRGAFVRPWGSPVPPFTESVEKNISYPCDEEDNGIVTAGWRGPSGITELYDLTGCILLMKYLTDNSVSPIQREFVEVEDPFACDVEFSPVENSESIIYLMFIGVPLQKISLVKERLQKVLKDVLISDNGIDLNRMATVIHRHQLETLSNLENMPHDAVTYMLIGDALFGRTIQDLEQRLNIIEDLKRLAKEPKSYWENLLEKYFIQAPMAVVNAFPSIQKQKELEEAEKKRISERVAQLGEEGLKKKDEEYQKAVLHNEKPIPEDLLTSIPVPGTDSINFHQVQTFQTAAEQHPLIDVNKFPLFTYLNHVNTNFVYMFFILDSANISLEDRPYLPLILEAIGECPIVRNGTLIPYEDVVAQLEADTIGVCTKIGFDSKSRFACGEYSHSIHLMIQLEISKYEKGIQWMKELLFDTKFTPERLKIIVAKLINEITLCKKAGSKITRDLIKGIFYKKESNHFNSSFLRQQHFLMKLMEKLNNEKDQKETIERIEKILNILTENMVLHMATNVEKLVTQVKDIYTPWSIVNLNNIKKTKLNVTPDWSLMKSENEIDVKGCVLGLGSIESSFMFQAGPSTGDFQSPDLPAILVCLQYLTQLEGPMWRQVRGAGLAYGCNIFAQPAEKLLYLTFYASTNVVAAYKQTKSIINSLIDANSWDKILYDSAKSSLIFKIVEKEKSIGSTVLQSLLSYFKQTPQDYNRKMVNKIYTVDIQDLNRVAKQYIVPLLDPKQCKTVIVCHPSKVSEVAEAFKSLNHDLKVFPTLEQSFLNNW